MIKLSKNTKYDLIILDVDGVLVNSKPNMRKSWNEVKKKLNLDIPFSNYFSYVGLPFEEILKNIIPDKKYYFKKIKKIYEEESKANMSKVRFYPNVKKTLNLLTKYDIRISIFTSKEKKRTKLILDKLNIKFNSINTPSRKIKGKPFPDQIFNAIKKARTVPKKTVMIGDSLYDQKASNAAGIDYIHAAYGYGKVNSKKKINNFYEILRFIF